MMSSHPYAFIIPAIVLKRDQACFLLRTTKKEPFNVSFFAVVSLIGNSFYIIDHFMIYFTSQDTSECKLLSCKSNVWFRKQISGCRNAQENYTSKFVVLFYIYNQIIVVYSNFLWWWLWKNAAVLWHPMWKTLCCLFGYTPFMNMKYRVNLFLIV